jgi:DNA-directed RNA polymerase subunit RPC12/RpoP
MRWKLGDCSKCGANVVETKSSSKVLVCEICGYVQ